MALTTVSRSRWLPLVVLGQCLAGAMLLEVTPAKAAANASETASKIAQPFGIAEATAAPVDIAQANPSAPPPTVNERVDPSRLITPPSPAPLPDEPLPALPSPDELLPSPDVQPPSEETPGDVPTRLSVQRYQVEGSTVFSPEELAQVTQEFTGDVTFAQLIQARTAVTQLYVNAGYVTSGAIIPPQTIENGVVVIRVIEGSVEEINVTGTEHLQPGYVRSRLRLAVRTPLNVNRLLEGLQLLQLDPLIRTISADLQAGVRPGTNRLEVRVAEADVFSITPSLNNGRSPSVGSFRRQIELNHGNLFGFGDRLSLGYSNTAGSNSVDGSYTIPINPRNGTVRLAAGFSNSEIISDPFDILEIESNSNYFELGVRQPLLQTPTEELAIGLTASRQESKSEFTPGGIITLPFPTVGSDAEGRTRVSALRFFQEWTQRSSQHVLAFRSQFSVGLDVLNATVSEDGNPDGRFVAWRGQGQWVRLLAPETLLLVRGDVQLTPDALVPLEQFGLGGVQSVRGYRQDALLTDNGALLSGEVRIPVLRVPEIEGILQVVPFIDLGTAWNEGPDPDTPVLAGTGLGLLWRQGDRFTARIDWGIPLISVDSSGDSLQENGIYFSISFSAF